MRPRAPLTGLEELATFAAGLPATTRDFPWGVRVAKVNGRIFVFLGSAGEEKNVISVKLPKSFEAARSLRCVTPTRYGLGRARWVTVDLDDGECPPIDLLADWIEESYRAIAPAKLLTELDREREGASSN